MTAIDFSRGNEAKINLYLPEKFFENSSVAKNPIYIKKKIGSWLDLFRIWSI